MLGPSPSNSVSMSPSRTFKLQGVGPDVGAGLRSGAAPSLAQFVSNTAYSPVPPHSPLPQVWPRLSFDQLWASRRCGSLRPAQPYAPPTDLLWGLAHSSFCPVTCPSRNTSAQWVFPTSTRILILSVGDGATGWVWMFGNGSRGGLRNSGRVRDTRLEPLFHNSP